MPKVLDNVVEAAVRAVAEVMFPSNDLGAPDWQEADVVRRTLEYMGLLPPFPRRMLHTLFTVVELSTPLLVGKPTRFSRLDPDVRVALIRKWRTSGLFPLRLIGDSLKGVLTMIYMSDGAVMTHFGMFKVCENPDDPAKVPIRPDALTKVEVPR